MAMNLMDIDDVGGKVHRGSSSVDSVVSLPYRQLGIDCISLEIEHSKSTYVLPLSKVQTQQTFLKTLHSLPEIRDVLQTPDNDIKVEIVNEDIAYDEINAIADHFDEGTWIMSGYHGCKIRLQDWEDLLHNGASITVIVESKALHKHRSPETEPTLSLTQSDVMKDTKDITDVKVVPTTNKDDKGREEQGQSQPAATANGWDSPPPIKKKGLSSNQNKSNNGTGWMTDDIDNNNNSNGWNNENTIVEAPESTERWNDNDFNNNVQQQNGTLSNSQWGGVAPHQEESNGYRDDERDKYSISDNASGSGQGHGRKGKWNHNHNNSNSSNNNSKNHQKSSKPGPPRIIGSIHEPSYLFTFLHRPSLPLSFPPDPRDSDLFEIEFPGGALYWELLKAVTYKYRIPRPKEHMASIDLTITELKVENVNGENCLVMAGAYTALGSTLMKDVGLPKMEKGERMYMMLV